MRRIASMAPVDAQVAHIWRRLGFGPEPGDVEAGVAMGPSALIDDLCARPPTTQADWAWPVTGDWTEQGLFFHRIIELMATSAAQVQERIYWVLSGLLVIASTDLVQYNDHKEHVNLLRAWPGQPYQQLLSTVAVSTGMQEYLSGIDSVPPHPNENLARELMELFSLGVTNPVTGVNNYTETDIKEVARALTGYRFDWTTATAYFDASYWDSGQKTFLGAARGAAALADVIDAIVTQDAFRTFVPRRLYREIVGLEPDAATLDQLADVWGATGDIGGLVHAIALRPEFRSTAAISARVKCPIELVVSAIRALGLGNITRFYLDWELTLLNQRLFNAPNVSGWPVGTAWLHAGHLIEWSKVASMFCFSDDGSAGVAVADQCPTIRQLYSDGSSQTGGDLALQLAGLRGVSQQTTQALRDFAAAGPWDFARAAGTMNLVLDSPEFLTN